MEAIFGIVEYDILIVDLLIYFSSGVFAKCLSMRDRNFLPTFENKTGKRHLKSNKEYTYVYL